MSLESDGGMILTGENIRTQRKTCPSATLSTTNNTWIDPGANLGLRGERPATNDLSHGMALCPWLSNGTGRRTWCDESTIRGVCDEIAFRREVWGTTREDMSRNCEQKLYCQATVVEKFALEYVIWVKSCKPLQLYFNLRSVCTFPPVLYQDAMIRFR
jgi:hypothetical protein